MEAESCESIIELKINGKRESIVVQNNWTLLNVLRDKKLLTGTKCGCNKGECGACTVLMNGQAVLSCLTLAVAADHKEILTIEGLSDGTSGSHPLQQAFVDSGAIQCGFCTPGMIMSAKALLAENPNPGEEAIREGINGNICRCTGYAKIVDAIQSLSNKDKDNG